MDDVTFDPEATPEEQAARIANSDVDGLARMAVKMQGQPFGTPNLTPDQELAAYMWLDPRVDHEALLAQGMPRSQVADMAFPFQRWLAEQAGTTFNEVLDYHRRMLPRAIKAMQSGRVPKLPEHSNPLEAP